MVSVVLYHCILCVSLLMDLFVLCVACLTVIVNMFGRGCYFMLFYVIEVFCVCGRALLDRPCMVFHRMCVLYL